MNDVIRPILKVNTVTYQVFEITLDELMSVELKDCIGKKPNVVDLFNGKIALLEYGNFIYKVKNL